MTDLSGKRVAILLEDGFDHDELHQPREALIIAGAETELISSQDGLIHASPLRGAGDEAYRADRHISEADPASYHALLIPGGDLSSARLRSDRRLLAFIAAFVVAGRPIAAISQGVLPLIAAHAVRGRRVIAAPSLRQALEEAGARWTPAEVVIDGPLITGRWSRTLSDFNHAMVELFAMHEMANSW